MARLAVILTLVVATSSVARAAPPGWPTDDVAAPAAPPKPGDKPSRAEREKILRKIHTDFILELSEILDLDTADTIRLAARLKPFDEKRIQLRMDTWDAMLQLKAISRGDDGDSLQVARRVEANAVEIAKLDQSELEELAKGLPNDKLAKAACFLAKFPRRIEQMAREIIEQRYGAQPAGDAPPGDHPMPPHE